MPKTLNRVGEIKHMINMATSWFLYQGAQGSDQKTNPAFYAIIGSTPTCNNGATVCAIFAEVQVNQNGVRRPILSGTLTCEINTADQLNIPSANVKLKSS